MSRQCYDSVNPWSIPTSAEMVAGYVDCSFAWSGSGWARFPDAIKVRIAAGCDPQDAQVADVENGDYLPWESVDFVLTQRAKGIDPSVYVDASNWAPTQTEFRLRGVAEPHWWIAQWDGVQSIPAGAVAKQYADGAMLGTGYDASVVADFWPGVDEAFGPGGGTLTGGAGLDVKVQPPFTVITDADTHWYGAPGGTDEGVMGARTVVVTTQTTDGQWFEYPGSTWWFPAAKSSLILPTSSGGADDDSALATKAYVDQQDNTLLAKIPTKATTTLA